MNDLFGRLSRLFRPRARPPADAVEQASADRPPPPEVAPAAAPPIPEAATDIEATTDAEATIDAGAIAEVRALLDEVAEAPPPVREPEPAHEPIPEPEPLFPTAPTEQPVEAPPPSPEPVGDALVLTLATPAATFTVARTAATIGRGQENTIRLDDLSVSRRHARVAYKQGAYWLSDLGSMGGTWVDGTRLNAPQQIAAGQVIDIGMCRLTVRSAGGAAKVETKARGQGRRRR